MKVWRTKGGRVELLAKEGGYSVDIYLNLGIAQCHPRPDTHISVDHTLQRILELRLGKRFGRDYLAHATGITFPYYNELLERDCDYEFKRRLAIGMKIGDGKMGWDDEIHLAHFSSAVSDQFGEREAACLTAG